MTTILLEEDIELINNKFKTKNDLLLFLLGEVENVVLWKEMKEILDSSEKDDFMSYENFILKYKV